MDKSRRETLKKITFALLVAPGRKSFDAAAVWQHGAANLGVTAACGIRETARQAEKSIKKDVRDGALPEKSLRDEAVAGEEGVARAVSEAFGCQFDGTRSRSF
jgi:hypothetical protein